MAKKKIYTAQERENIIKAFKEAKKEEHTADSILYELKEELCRLYYEDGFTILELSNLAIKAGVRLKVGSVKPMVSKVLKENCPKGWNKSAGEGAKADSFKKEKPSNAAEKETEKKKQPPQGNSDPLKDLANKDYKPTDSGFTGKSEKDDI